MTIYKFLLALVIAATVSACDSGADILSNTKPSDNAATSLLALLSNDAASNTSFDSDEAIRIAQTYPVPELPLINTPFQVQGDTRFDQWTLSSMIRHSETNEWVWTQQELFRVALTDKEAAAAASKWGFNGIVGQRFTQYDFGSKEHTSDATAERIALNLASVTKDTITLNNVSLNIINSGCESNLILQRHDEALTWLSSECPERVRVNDAVVGSTTSVLPNGISWVSQAYGQLPTGSGAVVIDRLELWMSDGKRLEVTRSRRKSGTGPATVAATLEGQTLRQVTWSDSFANKPANASARTSSFPSEILLSIPSLSQSFVVQIPKSISQEISLSNAGVQYGVTVTSDTDDEPKLPGVLLINPINRQAL